MATQKHKTTSTQSSLPTCESMIQVRALTGMPLATIRAAKASGCAAFAAGNRIKLEPLLKWFFDRLHKAGDTPPDGMASWREALNKVETQRAELRLAKERGEALDIATARAEVADAEAYYFGELDRLLREWPPALVGLTSLEILARMKSFVADLRQRASEKFRAAITPK